ncbi:MAG: phosphate ABC transporter permease PstA [Candidatus Margulisbacteria bacterium]|nr:phosphate ABC transporter permease PstA [Candidatus Margulisiibacteriota bacterium]
MDSKTRKRIIKNNLFKWAVIILSFLSLLPLIFIIFYLIKNGISVINWQFLVNLPTADIGAEGGGISNALVGTVILIILASIFAIPLGVTTGLFLSENTKGTLANTVRICVDILSGVPSIVIGIIAYIWVVLPLHGFSALSGGIALALMMLPVIIISTEETLRLIPYSLKEASLALGVPYSITMLKVILPSGISGIITGILLSITRIAGETAPLLFTAFGNPFMNVNILKPINSLPLLIYNYATSPYQEWHNLAWGASFVLLIFTFSLNFLTKVVTSKWKVQF